MIRAAAARDTSAPIGGAIATLVAAGAAVVWGAKNIATKGTAGIAEICAVAIAPLAAWIAWTRPLIVPYGLYAIVTPLDVLTSLSRSEGTVARLLGLLSAGALLLFAVRTRSLRMPPRAVLGLLLLCGWMALSTLWSIADDAGREATTFLEISGLYLALACFPTRRRDLVPLLGMILLGGAIAALIGIYEFRVAGVAETQTIQDFHRISVSLGQAQLDPNMYADSLLLPFAIALAWFVRAKRFWSRLGAFGVMALLVTAIALAGSRDATIGLAIETVMMTLALRAWRRVALPVGALIVTAIAAFPNAIVRAMEDNGGGYGRTSIWHVGWIAFLQHPLTGSGSGSFATTYDRWYLRIFERYDVGWDMASHDLLVHYGVELGLVGLALVVAWGAAQWLMARALPKIGLIGDVRAICLASLGALTFAAFFIDLFDVKFVWVLFGLIVQARSAALGGDR